MTTKYTEGKEFRKKDEKELSPASQTFSACHFLNLDFTGKNFAGAEFEECRFSGCHFPLNRLQGTGFRNVAFEDCKISGVDFSVCNPFLLSFRFVNCVLAYCGFYGLKLKKTEFTNCRLQECAFTECDLKQAVFTDCDLSGTTFSHTCLVKADLSTATGFLLRPENNDIREAAFSVEGALSLLSQYGIKIK